MATVLKKWLARESTLVRFKDDPALLHWRLVLVCVDGHRCLVATPDRDINDTILEVGDVFSEVIRMDGDRLPRRVRERDTYLPRHSGGGDLGVDERRTLMSQAEVVAERIHQASLRRRVTGKSGQDGRIHAAGPVASVSEPARQGRSDADSTWMVVYDNRGSDVGEERQPASDNGSEVVLKGERYFIWHEDGRVLLAKRVRKERLSTLGDLAKQGVTAASVGERDVRTLPVMFDIAEERWRTIAESLPELEEVDFADWPLQGPRTMFRDLRQLRRALNFLVSYDQLNVANIAGAEALNRRRTLIEITHQGRPEAPSYAGAEEVLGLRDSTDGSVVDPAIAAYAAKRQAAKAEIAGWPLKSRGPPMQQMTRSRGDALGTYFHCPFLLRRVDTISALNVLAGFDDRPPESESSQAALRQLLAKRAGYSVGPGALASYVRERVSLPRGQGEPVQIADLLPPEERYRLENFQNEMLLSSEEAAGVIESQLYQACQSPPIDDLHQYCLLCRNSYVFVAQCYTKRTRLWVSVAREMFLFRSLMVLGEANVMAQWSPDMFCTDASLSGYAVMSRRLSQEMPLSVRGFDERWRFKRASGSRVAPRTAALEGLDVFEDIETVLASVSGEVQGVDELVKRFPEVASGLMEQSQWHCLWAAPMRFR
ncbi:unnamed protein product [Symbiodinium sp. KB8]|nr:unnamed protein product [Symbiodinium sp. KB8]